MQSQPKSRFRLNNANFKKYLVVFGGLLLFGVLLACAPLLLQSKAESKIGLPGSEERKLYIKPPFPLQFKIYLFNITNKNEVTQGAKPIFEEIGPYVFEEWKEKFNLSDNEEDDTLTFNMKKTFIFRSDLSEGLTGRENITTVHALIMGMALAVNVNRKPMLSLVNKAINGIFHQPKDSFWTGRALDYLFDGIEIDCTSQEFAAKAACSIFESGMVKPIEPLRQDFYKFSVFGAENGSDVGLYKVDRGIKSIHNVGRIKSFNNKTEMDVWNGEECNMYKGTDSTIFPPGIGQDETLWSYEPDLCLSLGAQFDGDSEYKGVATMRFGLDFGDAGKNEKLQCYCSGPPNDCPRRGTINLVECLEVPIVLSLPHFYTADASLLTQSKAGLMPNGSKHAFFIDYETLTGSVLNAARRLQFNLDVVPIGAVDCMKHLPEIVMPLFWIEEITSATVDSQDYYSIIQRRQLLVVLQILQWMAIIAGASGTIFLTYMRLRSEGIESLHVTKSDSRSLDDKSSNAIYKIAGIFE